MWLADLFLPSREERFISLLEQHADILVQTAQTFYSYVTAGGPALSDEINLLEKRADDVLVELTNALRDTYVTPIDRQDIYGLGEAIDDMIDYLNNAAREIKVFQVSPTPQMREIAAILLHAAEAIASGVTALKKDPQEAWSQAREAQHAENMVEEHYRTALAQLFDSPNVAEIFKLREVYRHLSNSADRADAVGRIIGKIVVKTV